jgi:hypothetical protein
MCPPLVAHAGLFGPSNYWECILDRLPGTQNDILASQIQMNCLKDFPDTGPVIGKDKVGGLISVPHADDCTMKYEKNTASFFAAQMIYAACHQVYWD